MPSIAGHDFVAQPDGREVCACGKSWIDVAPASKADVNKPGWAHSGNLTDGELEQIEAERERRWRIGMGIWSKQGAL